MFTADLREAVFLRTQRLAARRNSPEGVVGLSGVGGDFVSARVPAYDSDVASPGGAAPEDPGGLMAVTTAQTVDVTQALAGLLGDVDGLRVELVRRRQVPAAGGGDRAADDRLAATRTPGSAAATLDVPARRSSPPATTTGTRSCELSRLVRDVANALERADVAAASSASSRSTPGRPPPPCRGQELPAYSIRVRVRA